MAVGSTGIAPLRGSLRAAPTCYDGLRQKPLQRSTLWPDRSIAPTDGHGHTRSRRVMIAAVSRSLSAETKRRQKINIRCSLAASSGMAFLGGLHCLGTRLRGNADCSTHHSPFHPLPALRKRRALFCSANSGRTKKAGYRHHAGMPGLRFHLLHGRLFALAGKNYPPAPHLPGRMGRKICP